MVLIDNNISPRVAHAIHALTLPDDQVVALREKFLANTTDETWLHAIGEEGGWTVISGDIRITRQPSERRAWRQSRLKGFFLAPGWSRYTNLQRTARLLLWWPKFQAQERLVEPGAIFQVPINPSSKLTQLPM